MDWSLQLKIRATLPWGKSPLSIKHKCPRDGVDRNASAMAKKHSPSPPPSANSLITSPTYLLQKLEVPLPCSHTVTSGTIESSVYITTQGPTTFLSRGHLEPLTAVRAQSCWVVKLTFHFQLYTSLRIYGVLPPVIRKHFSCGSQAKGEVYIFLSSIIFFFSILLFFPQFMSVFLFLPFYYRLLISLLFWFFLFSCLCSFFFTTYVCPALNTSSVLALL